MIRPTPIVGATYREPLIDGRAPDRGGMLVLTHYDARTKKGRFAFAEVGPDQQPKLYFVTMAWARMMRNGWVLAKLPDGSKP